MALSAIGRSSKSATRFFDEFPGPPSPRRCGGWPTLSINPLKPA